MKQMESVYCAVRTETVTQVNLSIRWLTVVTLTEGNMCVCVSLIYVTQYCWCDLMLHRIFTPNIIKNFHDLGYSSGLKKQIVILTISLHTSNAYQNILFFNFQYNVFNEDV